MEDVEMNLSNDSEKKTDKKKSKQVYLPHKPIEEDEELVCDESAYIMLRELQTEEIKRIQETLKCPGYIVESENFDRPIFINENVWKGSGGNGTNGKESKLVTKNQPKTERSNHEFPKGVELSNMYRMLNSSNLTAAVTENIRKAEKKNNYYLPLTSSYQIVIRSKDKTLEDKVSGLRSFLKENSDIFEKLEGKWHQRPRPKDLTKCELISLKAVENSSTYDREPKSSILKTNVKCTTKSLKNKKRSGSQEKSVVPMKEKSPKASSKTKPDIKEVKTDKSRKLVKKHKGAPCLSFDIIPDDLGNNRSTYPLSFYLVAGTQAPKQKENCILIMKTSNLHKTQKANDDEDEDDEDEESDDEQESLAKTPKMDYASVAHFGCINRIRTTSFKNTIFAAAWSEMGRVSIWDLRDQIQAVSDIRLLAKYRSENMEVNSKPVFTFSGHQGEGFAIDWCPTTEGVLASGDCKKNIHLWNPGEESWRVDQKPLLGHLGSVEDLQWSPNERHVLASASVDKTIRIWDTRLTGNKACMIVVENAHESDVNVISWNRNEPFIVSGGDDGCVHVWDLRSIQSGKSVAMFKHHTKPVTTVEWHPSEATVFASGGEDNQIALWDLGVEKDADAIDEEIENLPPQLLFIHQGQQDIKELHWHPQIPGLIVSTAFSGFNIFRTISV